MQLELSRSMLGGLYAAQIATLLSVPEGTLKLEIGGALRPAVQRYIQVLMTPQTQQGQTLQQQQQVAAEQERLRAYELAIIAQTIELQRERGQRGERGDEDRGSRFNANALRRMDPRILGYATIDATFRVRVEVLTLDNLGRPSRLVPLP